jgi:hypothetical protein
LHIFLYSKLFYIIFYSSDAKAAEAAQSAYYDPNRPQCAYVPPPEYYVSIILFIVYTDFNFKIDVLISVYITYYVLRISIFVHISGESTSLYEEISVKMYICYIHISADYIITN